MEYDKNDNINFNSDETEVLIEKKRTYDNSSEAVSMEEFRAEFVINNFAEMVWRIITGRLLSMFNTSRMDLGEFDAHRFRFYMGKDPELLRNHNAKLLEVFYRTTDVPAALPNYPESPWPDRYLGELYVMHNQDGIPTGITEDVRYHLEEAVRTLRYSVTEPEQFPMTLDEAKKSLKEHLYLPGTDLPYEDFTETLYRELYETLPRKMLF